MNGQQITFAAVMDPDASYTKYTWVKAKQGDTITTICRRYGRPDLTATVLGLNKNADVLPHPRRRAHQKVPPIPRLQNAKQKLRAGASIRLPGVMGPFESLSVYAGNEPPVIKAGYAKFDIVDVAGRVGINRFLGYDPIQIDIPIQFENYANQFDQHGNNTGHNGQQIEKDIQKLERFAGRGDYPGAGYGAPAVLSITVSQGDQMVPLIPPDYQYSDAHQQAPLFRITGIAWDAGALRTRYGYRIRQTATVTVTQYTPVMFAVRSVAQRTMTIPSRSAKKPPAKAKPTTKAT